MQLKLLRCFFMKIIINGKDAVLKKGTSFEFVDENRSFTCSDSRHMKTNDLLLIWIDEKEYRGS